MFVYAFAWWAVFWLPARKGSFSALAFIPAAIFAFAIPMVVADVIKGTPSLGLLILWSLIPFAILIMELLWRKKRNPN